MPVNFEILVPCSAAAVSLISSSEFEKDVKNVLESEEFSATVHSYIPHGDSPDDTHRILDTTDSSMVSITLMYPPSKSSLLDKMKDIVTSFLSERNVPIQLGASASGSDVETAAKKSFTPAPKPPLKSSGDAASSNIPSSSIQASRANPSYESFQHFNSKLLAPSAADTVNAPAVASESAPHAADKAKPTTASATALNSNSGIGGSNYSLFNSMNRPFDLAEVSSPLYPV